MADSIYTAANAKRGMAKVADALKKKVKAKLGIEDEEDGGDEKLYLTYPIFKEGPMTLKKEEPMTLKKKGTGETDSVAQASVLDDDHLEFTKSRIAKLKEKLDSPSSSHPEVRRVIQDDLNYWKQHALRMSKMGRAGDPTPNVRAFDPMRPMGMR
jgi:hypothetical protein